MTDTPLIQRNPRAAMKGALEVAVAIKMLRDMKAAPGPARDDKLQAAWAVISACYANNRAGKERPPMLDDHHELVAYFVVDSWFEAKGNYDEAIKYLEVLSERGFGIPQEVLNGRV